MLKPFFIALQFLTRLPLPKSFLADQDYSAGQLGKSVIMYPLVGVVIGLILIAVPYLSHELLPNAWSLVQAGLVLLIWVLITGALHLDGLSDSADAWVGGQGDRDRTMAIMKDPYCGPAGVSILVAVLIAKYAALTAVLTLPFLTLLVVPVLARAAIIVLFFTTPYVREDGIGASHASHMPKLGAYLMLSVVLSACFWLLKIKALWLLVSLAVVFVLLRQLMMKRLNGTTGDTTGAMVEVMELVGLLGLAIL